VQTALDQPIDLSRLFSTHIQRIEELSAASVIVDMAVAMSTPPVAVFKPHAPVHHTLDVSSSSSSSLSSLVGGIGKEEVVKQERPFCIYDHIPAVALTVNSGLERLLGYSRQEIHARMAKLGWKMVLVFKALPSIICYF
jgi:hypothetical protein